MPKRKEPEITLPSLDDLFSSQKTREDANLSKIRDIPISEIDDFPDHPFKVKDDEDMLALADSNLQRTKILPSEKAFSYKMRLEAMNRQGKRSDVTSGPLEPKLRSNTRLAKEIKPLYRNQYVVILFIASRLLQIGVLFAITKLLHR